MSTRIARVALVRERLTPEAFAARLAAVQEEAGLLAALAARIDAGELGTAVHAEIGPAGHYASVMRRLRFWREGGAEALMECRLPPRSVALPANIDDLIDAVAKALPDAPAMQIVSHLKRYHKVKVGATKVRDRLQVIGLARPSGRRSSSAAQTVHAERTAPLAAEASNELDMAPLRAEPERADSDIPQPTPANMVAPSHHEEATPPVDGPTHAEVPQPVPDVTFNAPVEVVPFPLAGAALLTTLDRSLGGTLRLARAAIAHASSLPPPISPVEDHRADRDERGRFTPAYNQARPRRFSKVGSRFEAAHIRWRHKDPASLRHRFTAETWTRLKFLAVVLLPVIAETGRLSELQYGLDDRLGQVVGRTYRPSTLQKLLNEVKLAGAADALGRAFVDHVLTAGGEIRDRVTGAVVLYGDAMVDPLWTRTHARSTMVSRRGKVMPAITRVFLHSGGGTPLRYAALSGHASVPAVISRLMDEYEEAAGPSTVQRVVVLDRESHAVVFFKEMGTERTFIISLRSSVTGPKATFTERGEPVPWRNGATVCEARLVLRDSRAGEDDLEVRVIGHCRHEGGSMFWIATNAALDIFSAADVARLYFDRWPCQELRFRDSRGRVGLGRHHGYGKEEIEHVTVVTELDESTARIATLDKAIAQLDQTLESEAPAHDASAAASAAAQTKEQELLTDLATHDFHGSAAQQLAKLGAWRVAREESLRAASALVPLTKRRTKLLAQQKKAQERRARLRTEQEQLRQRTLIHTVDTELDEIILSMKCLFLHLCHCLQGQYLGTKLDIDTLIRRVLTLPGEQLLDAEGSVVGVRIYRNRKDPEVTTAVEQAAGRLNALQIAAPIEVVDPPRGWIR